LPFSAEDLALTALVRILPRSRYRLAAQNDARFQSFASNTTRIAYRQQGATPAFLLFSGPGQNPHAAAMAAASWAEANWRPNAIQRKVRPGVVVVHVAPGNQLTPSGPVAGAAVPAVVWTVDSATGRVATEGSGPGSPSGAEIRHAASSLMRGVPSPSLGELDLAERGVMQLRTDGAPRWASGLGGLILIFFALRYGLAALSSVLLLWVLLENPGTIGTRGTLLYVGQLLVSVLLLAGILLGAGVLFNFRSMALRVPGFSSAAPATRNLTWAGYVAAMIVLAVLTDAVIPSLERQTLANDHNTNYLRVTATADDDGTDVYVQVGGEVTLDLSKWPPAEWTGVAFKTSNPSVLSSDSSQASGDKPIAHFSAREVGTSRLEATSADGLYSFQARVEVFAQPSPT